MNQYNDVNLAAKCFGTTPVVQVFQNQYFHINNSIILLAVSKDPKYPYKNRLNDQ